MGRELISYRIPPLTPGSCDPVVLCGISRCFHLLSPCTRQIAHALLTRPPLGYFVASYSVTPLDLHVLGTPSVRPEPGSNSSVQSCSLKKTLPRYCCLLELTSFLLPLHCSVFKDLFRRPSQRRLLYTSKSLCFCQHLFCFIFFSPPGSGIAG